jgi:hypothetical protein
VEKEEIYAITWARLNAPEKAGEIDFSRVAAP